MNRRSLLKVMGLFAVQSVIGGCGPTGASAGSSTTQPSDPNQENPTMVKVKVFNRDGKLVGPIEMPRVEKSDTAWQAQLTPEQYAIARAKGTEPAFCGNLLDNKKSGVY